MKPGDLLVLEALSRAETYSAAAIELDVSHTTVARKIRDLETHFGARLIERVGDRITMTREGEAAVDAARQIRDEMDRLERRIEGRDAGLFGHIILTTVDILAWHYMPKLKQFISHHPDITLDIDAETTVRSLSRRDAEVALRFTNEPEPYLYGKKIGRCDFAHYAPAFDTPPQSSRMVWLEYSGQACANRSTEWLKTYLPGVEPHSYVSSPLIMMQAIQAGLGEGLLPTQIVEIQKGLRRVSESTAFSLDIWLLAPKELRHTARVRALFNCLSS
ncbi:DNA-binding transcriptional regulator, LysR family [Aliiroseovarius halocynthiae]|uniref:LysR family transcriptional regulator n=1 Tax=Aliiroseovarius halocynthiae TaxID=985055 RepID=A0A545SU16_9RHOB|nr:LysR family transcriptional regulator [Aliiroseovarius halocynthiae]TQV68448.1 LysR family transcriptional regulator [Aliiroseovarius halocynthiae]SMR70844.1 DNA-binding transcriptional regulator, LysR family [Aliiroseovarius halocynthiae]